MFSTKAAKWGARNGVFTINNTEVATPNFAVTTTRGAVDHLTPDHAPVAPVAGVYAEDFWDRDGLVRACISDRHRLPLTTSILMGSCRRPGSRNVANKPNTMESFAIDTVQGSKLAPISALTEFMTELKPDVFLVPYDIPAQTQNFKVGSNRLRKMETRSLAWLNEFHKARAEIGKSSSDLMLVAQLPPELRSPEYLKDINEKCDAYCFVASGPDTNLSTDGIDPAKPRFGFRPNVDWRSVLDELSNGVDILFVPLTQFSNAGHALTLSWRPENQDEWFLDLNAPKYVTDTQQLGSTGHSHAYIHHLLEAGEMTAQVLLQQHNMKIIESLFEGIRESIAKNTFEEDKVVFLEAFNL